MNKSKVIMLSPDLDVKGGISFVVREYYKAGLQNKIDLYFIPTHKDGSNLKKITVFLSSVIKFLSFIAKMRGMIVHFHTSQNGSFFRKFSIFCLAKLLGAKTIVHIHGSQFDIFMNKNIIFRVLTKVYFNCSDFIFVMSKNWVKIISEFSNNKKIHLVYNPASVFGQKKSRHDDFINVLFMGRLGKRKGIYDLLDCIIDNKEFFSSKNVKFILAGDGETSKVSEIVDKQQIAGLVEVPGWIADKEKQAYLERADILILPSYNEQMPMSILEAMGYSCSIIATNIAGIPDMVENGVNGFLFEPGDKNAMVEALKNLCSDAHLREKMGKKSLEIVNDKFESTKIINQLVQLYQDLSNLK